MRARAGATVWLGLAVLLGAALAWRAWETHRSNAELYRRLCEAQAEGERVDAEAERLRAQRHALENDPMYVERQLRERRMTQPGEKLIEPATTPARAAGGPHVPR